MYRTPRPYELAPLKDFLLSAERSQAETEEYILANLENPVSPRFLASIFHEKAVDAYKAAGATVPRRPGFGLTLDWKTDDDSDVFPRLSFDDEGNASWRAHTLLIREVCMLRVMEELTNKPEWWRKVKDDEIAAKWKTEILQMDWKTLVDLWAVFTEPMADAVIAELRAKADLYQETGLIPVMDYSACAIKSDSLMSDALVQRLKAAVAPLEDVPDAAKDWHPGSNNKVLDLVHPSLFPVIYGRTRVLPNRTIGVADCLAHAGTGIPLPTLGQKKKQRNPDDRRHRRSTDDQDDIELSTNYQWLPCDVELKDGKATIASYVNNVHPVEHAALYPVIEEFINLALPAWDLVYRWPEEFEFKRMHWDEIYKWECAVPEFCKGECDPKNCPLEEGGVPRPGGGDDNDDNDDDDDDDKGSEGGDGEADKDDEGGNEEDDKESNGGDEEDNKESDVVNDENDNDEDDNDEDDNDDGDDNDDDDDDDEAYENIQAGDAREQWFVRHHTMILPDPDSSAYCGRFAASKLMRSSPSNLFAEALQAQPNPAAPGSPRLQVIVKLASIHLTPSKPQYDGGSWHVEGQLNERIVATALFYYDAHNVTPSALSFRTAANGEQLDEEGFYEQNDERGIERALAIRARGSVLQDIGHVVTSPGRALFFPNLYQHRVGSFRLADPTKPGHRKILALFLVDPKVPVLSTANVPPQQRAWWEREVGADPADLVRRKLPNELREMVLGGVDFPISLQEAKAVREELMAERKILVEDTQSRWDQTEFNFCEH
ncbi:hypothetical protein BBAD15_g5071 [Beauveria bassiana D1-5]|uniref:Uncharacterized protein n=1 Tax=Beauveria bassiana D1-5 TaxID=1245745 RepID=A0A0A2VTW1_BEABA|nr:hypothetical protein BBAD15_g5071 [Beauveria bassiana D1-5]